MKLQTAIRKTFNKINKDYPLLRKGLRAYFVEIIIRKLHNQYFDYWDNMYLYFKLKGTNRLSILKEF